LTLRAEHAVAADRCARKIVGFLAACVARLRRLNGKPLGGREAVPSPTRAMGV